MAMNLSVQVPRHVKPSGLRYAHRYGKFAVLGMGKTTVSIQWESVSDAGAEAKKEVGAVEETSRRFLAMCVGLPRKVARKR